VRRVDHPYALALADLAPTQAAIGAHTCA
jgi:hypothetical protein